MATEFDQTEELHYVGFYTGTVLENEDPEQLGRVRIKIPGVIEPSSAWAFPLGTLMGGTASRGWFAVPEVSADVGVFFYQGDVDTLFYVPGHWGVSDGLRESPLQLSGLDKTSRLKVTGYETARYQMVFDERDPAQFFVLDKVTGDSIAMSPDKVTLKHSALVVVDAPKVYLGGDNLNEDPLVGEGVVLASGIDPFSGKTQGQLGAASTKVFAKKL